jgi:hypothetical protein
MWTANSIDWTSPELRDYCNDLNAMYEAEGVLSDDQLWDMAYTLETQSPLNFRSTARQRAEAFLRVLGKWKGTEGIDALAERRKMERDRRDERLGENQEEQLGAEKAVSQRDKMLEEFHQIEQILGKALGYPWFEDDPANFPNATEADGVAVGDHTAWSLAHQAADMIKVLGKRDQGHHKIIDSHIDEERARKHRPEPSRIEIAAMAMQGLLASGDIIIDVGGTAVKYADALMNAAKEAK